MARRTFRLTLFVAALAVGFSFVVGAQAPIANGDAELQLQLANLLVDENRHTEALQAYERALRAEDRDLAVRAHKGKVRVQLKLAQYAAARREAEALVA